jgi:hypothetical protein
MHRLNILQKIRYTADEFICVSGFKGKAAKGRVRMEQLSKARPSLGIKVPEVVRLETPDVFKVLGSGHAGSFASCSGV